jgi:hypothetical protein
MCPGSSRTGEFEGSGEGMAAAARETAASQITDYKRSR